MSRSLPRRRVEAGIATPLDDGAADLVAVARRRGAVAGLRDEAELRALLGDPVGAVRAAALAQLARLGDALRDDVERLLADPDPEVRRRTCELAGAVPEAGFASLLEDEDPAVAEAAAFAVGEVGDTAAVERLVSMARTAEDPLCRESAVAALGAIGDERGRAAVIAALEDTPAIRRRAVVALSAFESAEVTAALRQRLEDRDWQVRQAAEEVLRLSGEPTS